MAGDTWVANDGRIAGAYFGTCWISDTGPYTGPNPAIRLADAAWVPADANTVELLICARNPDTVDTHVLNGAYTATDYDQTYFAVGGTDVFGDPAALDASPHLFLVWFQPGIGRTDDPALLVAPSASPLDLAPVGWVSGGRLTAATAVTAAFDFGGLSLAADTTSTSILGSVAFTFGGLRITATAGRPAASLYDTDGVTWLANLPLAKGITFQVEVNRPGSLSLQLPLDDAATLLATPGRYLRISCNGHAQIAARIADSTTDLATDGRAWVQFNQLPGALNLLADAVVYPEFWPYQGGSSQRTFGYMARGGFWTQSGNYTVPEEIRWSAMTGVRAGMPEGLDYPNPYWIAKRSPSFYEPVGATQYFRRAFETFTDNIKWQILATADNSISLWLDGEQIVTPDMQNGLTWRQLAQVTGTLRAGDHVLAAKIVNTGKSAPSPMGLIVVMQQLQENGDVVVGPSMIQSDRSWHVADNVPGFQRADVLIRLQREAVGRAVPSYVMMWRGFSTEADSNGTPWSDTPGEYTFDVMSSMLDVQQQLCEKGMDCWVDPDIMQLEAYVRQGTDRYLTVRPDLGKDGGAIVAHQIARTAPRANTALVQIADGRYSEQADSAAVAAYGRIETGLSLGSTSQPETAAQIATASFAETAQPFQTFTTELPAGHGPQPFVDFFLGDCIGVPNGSGGYQKVRVVAITVDASDEKIRITPELVIET